MGFHWLVGLALLGAPFAKTRKAKCGVAFQQPDDALEDYESINGVGSGIDLGDELCSLEIGDLERYRALRRQCRDFRDRDKGLCRNFGVGQWNLTCFKVVGLMSDSVGEELCPEDQLLFDQLGRHTLRRQHEDEDKKLNIKRCNAQSPVCKKIEGKVRLVGFAGRLSPESAKVLAQFPYLFSVLVTEVTGVLKGATLPDTLRVFQLSPRKKLERAVAMVAPLLRAHGRVETLQVEGGRSAPNLDLSHFCGLDLRRFSGSAASVGSIPECWSSMKSLVSFYCTGCRMTSPPLALRGLQSLRSFVAFRQSELEACASKKMEKKGLGPCKPSWETMVESPNMDAKGRFYVSDASFKCAGVSYAFPFRDLLYLGWTNVEKVWLDGNFLTGQIPEDIAEVWPSLHSLDLYDNSMHGEIPKSLARLDLVKFQVNGNNFSGTFPRRLAAKLTQGWLHLGVAGNPLLQGCLPHKQGMAGTLMSTCARNEL